MCNHNPNAEFYDDDTACDWQKCFWLFIVFNNTNTLTISCELFILATQHTHLKLWSRSWRRESCFSLPNTLLPFGVGIFFNLFCKYEILKQKCNQAIYFHLKIANIDLAMTTVNQHTVPVKLFISKKWKNNFHSIWNLNMKTCGTCKSSHYLTHSSFQSRACSNAKFSLLKKPPLISNISFKI